jgi:hypothetical protein
MPMPMPHPPIDLTPPLGLHPPHSLRPLEEGPAQTVSGTAPEPATE